MSTICMRALAGCLAGVLFAAAAQAQEDRLAKCPDPEAARQYVKECLAASPYNTKETCEELALEKFCKK
jgi:hypothetical protein